MSSSDSIPYNANVSYDFPIYYDTISQPINVVIDRPFYWTGNGSSSDNNHRALLEKKLSSYNHLILIISTQVYSVNNIFYPYSKENVKEISVSEVVKDIKVSVFNLKISEVQPKHDLHSNFTEIKVVKVNKIENPVKILGKIINNKNKENSLFKDISVVGEIVLRK